MGNGRLEVRCSVGSGSGVVPDHDSDCPLLLQLRPGESHPLKDSLLAKCCLPAELPDLVGSGSLEEYNVEGYRVIWPNQVGGDAVLPQHHRFLAAVVHDDIMRGIAPGKYR